MNDTVRQFLEQLADPIDMLLYCPGCGHQHIDKPDRRLGWTNPPHRTHMCERCGYLWRPCDVATNGVAKLRTKGQGDMDPAPSNVAVVGRANNQRDRVWYRAMLIGLPVKTVGMLLAVFERCAPEMQGTSDNHRIAWRQRQTDDLRGVAAELAEEPLYTLPAPVPPGADTASG